MDRVKNRDEVFTLKWFAEFINSLGFESVKVLDPHSNVAMALIDRAETMDVKHYIDYAIQWMVSQGLNPLLCYPDEGAPNDTLSFFLWSMFFALNIVTGAPARLSGWS